MGIPETTVHCREREKRGIREERTPKGLRKSPEQKQEADQTGRAATRFVRQSSGMRGLGWGSAACSLHQNGVGGAACELNSEGEKEDGGFSIRIMKDEQRKSRKGARLKIPKRPRSPTALLGETGKGGELANEGQA